MQAGLDIYVNNSKATPDTLNSWLEATGGYTCMGGDCQSISIYESDWLASNIRMRDVFLLSDPSALGAVGPNQNTSRIQDKAA